MRLEPVLSLTLTASLAVASLAGGAQGPATRTLISDRLNGTYEDLAADIEPVTLGGMTIRLASPSHRLEVLQHRLELTPHQEGGHAAVFASRVQGEARLVAQLDLSGIPGRLEDKIVLPLQEVRLDGRVAVDRVESGYLVTLLEAPANVELTVESQMGQRLVGLCEGLSFFALGGDACEGLERSLSRVRLPLPRAGESRLIEADQLTEAERRQIESYLASSPD